MTKIVCNSVNLNINFYSLKCAVLNHRFLKIIFEKSPDESYTGQSGSLGAGLDSFYLGLKFYDISSPFLTLRE